MQNATARRPWLPCRCGESVPCSFKRLSLFPSAGRIASRFPRKCSRCRPSDRRNSFVTTVEAAGDRSDSNNLPSKATEKLASRHDHRWTKSGAERPQRARLAYAAPRRLVHSFPEKSRGRAAWRGMIADKNSVEIHELPAPCDTRTSTLAVSAPAANIAPSLARDLAPANTMEYDPENCQGTGTAQGQRGID